MPHHSFCTNSTKQIIILPHELTHVLMKTNTIKAITRQKNIIVYITCVYPIIY